MEKHLKILTMGEGPGCAGHLEARAKSKGWQKLDIL